MQRVSKAVKVGNMITQPAGEDTSSSNSDKDRTPTFADRTFKSFKGAEETEKIEQKPSSEIEDIVDKRLNANEGMIDLRQEG